MKAVVIAPDKITRVLVIATLTLTLLSLLEQVIGLTSGLFNLGTDASLPTWYASLSLLFSAILLSFIAMDKRRSRDRYANHWTWLALIFYGLSIDEVAMIHERIGDAFKESALKASLLESSAFPAAIEGIFHYAWVLVAVPAVSIRSEEHTSELQSPVPISYAVFCLKKKKKKKRKEKKKKRKEKKRRKKEKKRRTEKNMKVEGK